MQKWNRNVILLLNTWASQTLDTTSCIIYPVDATINSAWAETFSPTLKSKSCVKEGVRRCDVPARSSLTWIGVNLLYILQSPPSFLRFLVYSRFSLPMSLPAAGCRCNRADGWLVSPDAQQSVAPLPMAPWHKMRAHCAAGRLLLHTAADTGERRSCTVETEREEKRREERRLVTTRRNTSGQKEESWEEESETLNHKIWLIYPISIIHPQYYSNTDVYVCFPTIYNKGEYKSYFRMIN